VKKSGLVLICVCAYACLTALSSCEIPQSITIKGKPGVYIPLGNPFDDSNRLEDHINRGKLKEMMGDEDDIRIYDYTGNNVDAEVLSYIIHYPILEMRLEFVDGELVNPPKNLSKVDNTHYLLEGHYQIDNSLRNFLGSGVTFKKAPGYIYVDSIGDASTMSLTFTNREYTNKTLVSGDGRLKSLPKENRPQFPQSEEIPFDEPIPMPHSLVNQDSIILADIFNAQSAPTLNYQIKMPLDVITERDEVIVVDLIIELPLEFEVRTQSVYENKYVKLDLGNAFPTSLTPEVADLFGRKGNNDDIFNNLDMVKISLIDFKNNILFDGNISILIVNANHSGKPYQGSIKLNTDLPSLTIPKNELPYPFSPRFEFVLEKDAGKDYATLKIRRFGSEQPQFEFFMTVEVQADIKHTLSLSQ